MANAVAECDQGRGLYVERNQNRNINGGRNEREEVKLTGLPLLPKKDGFHPSFQGRLYHISQR